MRPFAFSGGGLCSLPCKASREKGTYFFVRDGATPALDDYGPAIQATLPIYRQAGMIQTHKDPNATLPDHYYGCTVPSLCLRQDLMNETRWQINAPAGTLLRAAFMDDTWNGVARRGDTFGCAHCILM